MKNTKKIWWLALPIGIVIIWHIYWGVRTYNDNRITLDLQSGDTTIPCHFQIGQTQETVVDILEDARINYDSSQDEYNREHIVVKATLSKYFFIFIDNNLIRIEMQNWDGGWVILPQNYHY